MRFSDTVNWFMGSSPRYAGEDGLRLLRGDMALRALALNAMFRFGGYRDGGELFWCYADVTRLVRLSGSGAVVRDIHLKDLYLPYRDIRDGSVRNWPSHGRYEWDYLFWEDAVSLELADWMGDDVVLMDPVPLDGMCMEQDWKLVYVDVDAIEVDAEDLLVFPEPQRGSRWWCYDISVRQSAPRLLSRAWRKIYERYRHDRELLSLIYHDSLWYHTGRHLHFVIYGHWREQQSMEWLHRWRGRLEADMQQQIHPRMKVRLAGTINPRNGQLALGYMHPFALPYIYPYSRSEMSKHFANVLDQRGIYRADMDIWRPDAPEPVSEQELNQSYPDSRFRMTSPVNVQWFQKAREKQCSLPLDATSADAYNRLQEREGKSVQRTEMVSLWKWTILFQAAPYGMERAKKLGAKYTMLLQDRLEASEIYTEQPPSWAKGGKSYYQRDFRAFVVKVCRVEVPKWGQRNLRARDEVEDVLGISVLVELEWGVLRQLRSANRMADALAFIWLNHLKRIRYQHGVIPHDEAVSYLTQHPGWSQSNARMRLRRLVKLGWLSEVRSGYVVHSWAYIARIMHIACERLYMVNGNELKDVKSLKSVMASIPGTHREPEIKYEIGKQLGIHASTVKRNRKGRLREWYRVYFVDRYSSREEAEHSRLYQKHPVHLWPLMLCGYRMYPQKLGRKWALARSSAASVLDLVIIQRCGKGKRLRRSTNRLAVKGGGAGLHTFERDDQQRYCNFPKGNNIYSRMSGMMISERIGSSTGRACSLGD